MNKSDFYFNLPEELIAQHPAEIRDHSRLMLLDKNDGSIEHKHFYDIVDYLSPSDCLVLNNTRVLPARLIGNRTTGGISEILLLKDKGGDNWECLVKPGKKMKPGTIVTFGNNDLVGEVVSVEAGGNRIVHFSYEGIFLEILEKLGKMPLPPYIYEELNDSERYQTVYSKELGSAAAPTAGLHFTNELLNSVRSRGVETAFVTLHVGLGTFRPVKEEKIEDHDMHSEFCIVPETTADVVNRTHENGGKVIAVGTTSCRTLESFTENGILKSGSRWTDIFIYPGYSFKCVDALITNFHLPESTLIMLVSALAGRENVLKAYETAVENRYRFFSFGDAMFIK